MCNLCPLGAMAMPEYAEQLPKVAQQLRAASRVLVLSGAGMSTAAGIPDFRSPGGLYGTSEALLDRFTYLGDEEDRVWQRKALQRDVKAALTLEFFRKNPLPYHEMRRGFILGLGRGQWKLSLGHVFPQLLAANGKLHLLASQNIDGLDHKVVADKSKLYNPHGLMSALVSEPLLPGQRGGLEDIALCMDASAPVYQRYTELVAQNIKDIYADRPHRKGRSNHLWPAPAESTPITLAMFGDLLPAKFHMARDAEARLRNYSVKPGSVLFDRQLWTQNAAHEDCDAFDEVERCDMVLVMGTSLSGLTIDHVAHRAGCPRVVFDMTTAPVESIKGYGTWRGQDSLLQGPIDTTVLDLCKELGWLEQLLQEAYLQHLCLASLRALRDFVQQGAMKERVGWIEGFIQKEVERERTFYFDE